MDTILTDNIWQQVKSIVRKEKRKAAAIAYVSTNNFIRFKQGDTLVCDASDQAIGTGETSAAVLREFFNAGAELYSCQNLHAKVLVFGKNVLIGSSNLSQSSADSLRELALLTTRSQIISQASAFIHRLKENSIPINKTFIERISKIKVIRQGPTRRKRTNKPLIFGNRTWLFRVYLVDSERYKEEEKYVKKAEKIVKKQHTDLKNEISWVRWTGKSRLRQLAREGDTIIVMHSASRGKQITISAPTPILKRQDQDHWTRFYYELPAKSNEMSWTEFSRNLKRFGIRQIKKNSARELNKRDTGIIDSIWDT